MQHGSARGPLFIVSMSRGGSSLLYALLNQHPQVALTYEAELLLLNPVFLKPPPLRDWPERWEFLNSAPSRHGVEPGCIPAGASFRTAFERFHREYASRKAASIWGDKSPQCYDRMTFLARKFPGACFIVVWRNPADTARSIVRAAASGNAYFQRRGVKTRSLVGYRVFRKQYQSLLRLGIPVHALDYEDLTRNTRTTMEEVCKFLQIPFDPRVSTLENADRSSLHPGEHHTFLRGDEIVSGVTRAEVLESEWRSKIARYLRLWRRQHEGWPAYPKLPTLDLAEPTMKERLLDDARYICWRLFDQLIYVVYSFVPLGILRRHKQQASQSARADG